MQDFVARPPVALVLTGPSVGLAPGARRLKAAEYAHLASASEALAEAQAVAADIVQRAAAVREEARRAGLAEGRAQARGELADSIAALRGQLAQWVRETEPQLVEIALRCVREIVRSSDMTSLVRDSLDRALAEMAAAQDIRIQVHESQVERVREEVEALMQRHALRGVIRVEPAMALQPGDCIVESPLGVVDLRVESQLRFVQQTLKPE